MTETITAKRPTSTSGSFVVSSYGAQTRGKIAVEGQPRLKRRGGPSKKLESAVYGYVRSLRALGRKTVNTVEIASALGVSPHEVEAVLSTLKKRGVKVAV